MLEKDYPYKGLTRVGCKANWSLETVRIKDFVDVPSMNPEQLARAVMKGPVAAAIQANSMVFMQYAGGVITDADCFSEKEVNHAVLIVGYGVEEGGMQYFLLKNSWGETWGDKGYVKIGFQQSHGICGIQVAPLQFEMKGLSQPSPADSKKKNSFPKPQLNLATMSGYLQ